MTSRDNADTKERIRDALAELLREKPLNSISASDICKLAGVSRQTFYNHFADKYAVPQWHFDLICQQYLYETGRSLSFADAVRLNTQALLQSKDFLTRLTRPKGYQSLFSYARRGRRQTLLETLSDYKRVRVTREIEDLVEYHVQGETQLICLWIEGGMEKDPGYLTDLIVAAVPRKLYKLLKDPALPRPDPTDMPTPPLTKPAPVAAPYR